MEKPRMQGGGKFPLLWRKLRGVMGAKAPTPTSVVAKEVLLCTEKGRRVEEGRPGPGDGPSNLRKTLSRPLEKRQETSSKKYPPRPLQ